MKPNKIFRWIWRINAITFLLCSLIFVTVMSVALYPSVKDYIRRKPVHHASEMVNVEENIRIDADWVLGEFGQIGSSGIMVSPVYSKQEYTVGMGSEKEASAIRNYLFLDTADKTTHWLSPTNKNLFINRREIKESPDNDAKVISITYELVADDTNSGGRLARDDKVTLAISSVDGSNFTELIGGIDEFLGDEQPDTKTLLIFYRSDGKSFLAELNLLEKRIIQTRELPKING